MIPAFLVPYLLNAETTGASPQIISTETVTDLNESLNTETVYTLIKEKSFSAEAAKSPPPGISRGTVYSLLTVEVPSEYQGKNLMLRIGNIFVDKAELYSIKEGASRPFPIGSFNRLGRNSVPVWFRTPVISFPSETGSNKMEMLLVFSSETSLKTAFTAETEEEAYLSEIINIVILSLTFGALSALLLYNLFIFISTSEKGYFFYSVYLFFFLLFQLQYAGFSARLFQSPYIFHGLQTGLAGASVTGTVLFTMHFLELKRISKILYYLFLLVLLSSVSLIFLTVFPDLHIILMRQLALTIIFFLLIALVSAGAALKKGERSAIFFFTAWILNIGFIALEVYYATSGTSYSLLGEHALKFGAVSESVLLSLALADKINLLRRDRENSKQQLLEMQTLEAEKERIYANAARRFVPAQFLHSLGRTSITEVMPGDSVQVEMTVLFTDIEDFTGTIENLTPSESFAFVNEYIRTMNPVIEENKGFVDKYLGDAIMALFPDPGDAVRCAIAMKKKADTVRMNGSIPLKGAGFGIHAGPMIMGTIGDNNRLDTTVIADAVNIAARLESLNRKLGTGILITEDTLSKTNMFRSRFIGETRLKGKEKAVRIHQILDGYSEEEYLKFQAAAPFFDEAVKLFQQGDSEEAAHLFGKILEINILDGCSRYYLNYIENKTTKSKKEKFI